MERAKNATRSKIIFELSPRGLKMQRNTVSRVWYINLRQLAPPGRVKGYI